MLGHFFKDLKDIDVIVRTQEEGETFDDAIKREIYEETHLTPSNIKYMGLLNSKGAKLAVYVCYLTDEEAKVTKLGNEGQALGFFTLDEMCKIELSFLVRAFFEKFKPQIRKMLEGTTINPKELGLV